MALTSLQKYKLKRFIRTLEKIRGRHTELVSVYVPQGYDLNKIINHLFQEQGTASNIKDKTTRTHVQDSLEKMIRHLRLFKKTPEHGLAVFAGDASDREGKADIKVWSIEPPEPITTRIYRCDQSFQLDILKNMLEHKDVYGLIVLDRREANIGLLKGTHITEITELTSGVPGKIKAGGQSAARFSRLREGAIKEFLNRINEAVQKEFLPMKNLKGILVGGPGNIKENFIENYLNRQLKDKIISVQDLSYTGDFGLKELVERSKADLAKESITEEKEIMEKFFKELATNPEKVTYGKAQVEKAIELNAAREVLISEDIDDDTAETIEEKAEATGAEVRFISTDTSEGVQLKELGGLAAFLRFQIE